MDAQPKLRLSRPTNHLEAILSFYVDGLGFEVLDRFDNQQGWDGVILGHRDWPYQFEFTARRDESVVPPAPTPEHFLVFCIPEGEYWQKRLKALFEAGFQQVTPPQLYADEGTATYEDPAGRRQPLHARMAGRRRASAQRLRIAGPAATGHRILRRTPLRGMSRRTADRKKPRRRLTNRKK